MWPVADVLPELAGLATHGRPGGRKPVAGPVLQSEWELIAARGRGNPVVDVPEQNPDHDQQHPAHPERARLYAQARRIDNGAACVLLVIQRRWVVHSRLGPPRGGSLRAQRLDARAGQVDRGSVWPMSAPWTDDQSTRLPPGTRVWKGKPGGGARFGTVMPYPPEHFRGSFPVRFDDQIWEMLDVSYVTAVSPEEEAAIRSQPQCPAPRKAIRRAG